MAIPKVKKQDILNALKYIDKNGVPSQHESTGYDLILPDGKKYPPKYVIAVANHLVTGSEIMTQFQSTEARRFLESLGFRIVAKQMEESNTGRQQEEFYLTITQNNVTSTNEQFTMNDIFLGDHYKPLDVFFETTQGEKIRRSRSKGERRISNQTMPRLAFQIFEDQISSLSQEERENFPICKYTSQNKYNGIYSTIEEFQKDNNNTIEYVTYINNGKQFVIYCWNIFSTILFVQECLKRFGKPGEKFILTYSKKDNKEDKIINEETKKDLINPLSATLIKSKNLIFRGAPGTGKSFLAREIAADIVSNGSIKDYNLLDDDQKKQVEFVQFHPSYDYTDFVEGLRPKLNEDGTMGFELKDGIFKSFINRAKKNYENSQQSPEILTKEVTIQEALDHFFNNIKFGLDTFMTTNGIQFIITSLNDSKISLSISSNDFKNNLFFNLDDLKESLQADKKFKKVEELSSFLGRPVPNQTDPFLFTLYELILGLVKEKPSSPTKVETLKNFVFIIDEINRGEISKIFGELFFSIDPDYRGKAGEVSTQYANLHSNQDDKFYIPENVYIIGTMNDIDRSVDCFDFAMRRRFPFIELKPSECLEMLNSLENESLKAEAIKRLTALNEEIINTEDLNENYQIGPSYFLKLKTCNFDQLWEQYLKPLLQEYVRGLYNEKEILERFAQAYGYSHISEGIIDESSYN